MANIVVTVKRKRKTNYAREEVEALLNILKRYPVILRNGRSSQDVYDKEIAWKSVEREFNEYDYCAKRNYLELRRKYRDLVAVVKRHVQDFGDEAPLSPISDEVRTILRTNVIKLEDYSFDGDCIEESSKSDLEVLVESPDRGNGRTEEPSAFRFQTETVSDNAPALSVTTNYEQRNLLKRINPFTITTAEESSVKRINPFTITTAEESSVKKTRETEAQLQHETRMQILELQKQSALLEHQTRKTELELAQAKLSAFRRAHSAL